MPAIVQFLIWAAVLGGIVLFGSRFASKVASKADAAVS